MFDEILPRKLRSDFGSEHEDWTVRDKGWLGKKNGELLKLMVADNFELFITVDKNLPYQQNLDRLPLTIFVLKSKDNRRSSLQKLIPLVFERINIGNLQYVIEITIN
ncbi:MAG: hypothetical protein RLY89_1482 [Bacteroidota bacterium]